jgi:hypothetical protein
MKRIKKQRNQFFHGSEPASNYPANANPGIHWRTGESSPMRMAQV